jgi:hypothetical protein
MKFVIGLILAFFGLIFVTKTEWFMNNIGAIEFFEEKLSTSGGSRFGYKLLGMFLIFLGVLAMTGLIDGFLGFVLSPLIRTMGGGGIEGL